MPFESYFRVGTEQWELVDAALSFVISERGPGDWALVATTRGAARPEAAVSFCVAGTVQPSPSDYAALAGKRREFEPADSGDMLPFVVDGQPGTLCPEHALEVVALEEGSVTVRYEGPFEWLGAGASADVEEKVVTACITRRAERAATARALTTQAPWILGASLRRSLSSPAPSNVPRLRGRGLHLLCVLTASHALGGNEVLDGLARGGAGSAALLHDGLRAGRLAAFLLTLEVLSLGRH